MAARALGAAALSPQSTRTLAELCRRAGALEEAAALYARLAALDPGDAKARALAAILTGAPRPPAPPGVYWPASFARLRGFLAEAQRAEILALALARLPQFAPARLSDDADGAVDPARRSSLVLEDTADFVALFMPRLHAALAERDLFAQFAIERPARLCYELQVTCHGDGAFFTRHTDDADAAHFGRLISFVYYFRRAPDAFTGGDLLLYDADEAARRFLLDAYTRIAPEDNSIAFFPASSVHEVDLTRVPSGDACDGRFSVNGWVRVAPTDADT